MEFRGNIGLLIAFAVIAISIYIYELKFAQKDSFSIGGALDTHKDAITTKMKTSAFSGLMRGCMTGYMLGGPMYSVISGATMSVVNPIMTYFEGYLAKI